MPDQPTRRGPDGRPYWVAAKAPECYVGIDLGTQCGFAVVDARCLSAVDPQGSRDRSILIASGHWDLSGRTGDGAGVRYLRARRAFYGLIMQHRPIAVGYELVRRHGGQGPRNPDGSPGQHYDGVAAAHVYGGLLSALSSLCEELGVPYMGHEVAHLKQHATGKGNASKAAMLEAARATWPAAAIGGPDEADACWIADRTRSELDLPL
jgi:hypothetical protein